MLRATTAGRRRRRRQAASPRAKLFNVLLVGALSGLMSGAALTAEPKLWDDRPASYWIAKLRNGSRLERRDAAMAMGSLTPNDPNVVPLLIGALEQRGDYALQINAVNALKEFGPRARPAIPALVATLKAPDQEDDSVRAQAASALAIVSAQAPESLIRLFQVEENEAIQLGLLRTFMYMKTTDPRVLARIEDILLERGKRPDSLRDAAVLTLQTLGDTIDPWILQELGKTTDWGVRRALVQVLSWHHSSVGDRTPPQAVVDAFLSASRDPEPRVASDAVTGLSNANARGPDVRARLVEILRTKTTDTLVVGPTVKAGSELFPHDQTLARLTANWLERGDYISESDITSALIAHGDVAIAPALEILRHGEAGSQARAAHVLGSIRARADVVSALQEQLASPDTDLREASAEALGELAPNALSAVPALLDRAVQGGEDERKTAWEAMGSLASYALAHPVDARPYLERHRSSLIKARDLAGVAFKDAEGRDTIATPLAEVVAAVERERLARRQVFISVLLAIVLVAAGALFASWRLRRRLLVALGGRWAFHINSCDVVARVLTFEDRYRVLISQNASNAAMLDKTGFGRDWPPPIEFVEPLKTEIGDGRRVRFEIDLGSFSQPWGPLLAGGLADTRNNIAGQICLTGQPQAVRSQSPKTIAFAALACGADDGVHGPLAFAALEADALRKVFKRWGADIQLAAPVSKAEDFVVALQTCDIVHVSAHATFDRIFFADRAVEAHDLPQPLMDAARCRFLVLSACDAGNLEQSDALLWRIVQSGVSVIAARHPVPDHICRAFFEELYRAMLPTQRAQGVELAKAIQEAVAATRRRIANATTDIAMQGRQTVDEALNAFVLFGDPTLNLKLERPRA